MLFLNKYGYLIIFLINLAFSFYFTALPDYNSLIGLFVLYLGTAIFFGFEWVLASHRFKIPEESPIVKSVYLLTHIGDRIMFLAISAVSDALVFAISISDTKIAFLENAIHIPLFIALICLFIIPWFTLYLSSFQYMHSSEDLIYMRFRTVILNNTVQVPAELLPYFVPGLQLRTRAVPKKEPVSQYDAQGQGPVLYAYPNPASESWQTTAEETASKEFSTSPSNNPVVDEKTRILEVYNKFLYQIYPELESYLERTPVAIQNTLILTIVAQRIPTDTELLVKISSLGPKINF